MFRISIACTTQHCRKIALPGSVGVNSMFSLVCALIRVSLSELNFMPHLESFRCKRKFEINFVKKDPIQPSNGVLPIHKLQFPFGSYRNGVCRALWAIMGSFEALGVCSLF